MKILMAPDAGDGPSVVVVSHEDENMDSSSTAPSSSFLSPLSSCSSSESSSSAFMALAAKALAAPTPAATSNKENVAASAEAPVPETTTEPPESEQESERETSRMQAPPSPTPSRVLSEVASSRAATTVGEEEEDTVTGSQTASARKAARRKQTSRARRPAKLSVTFNTTTPAVIHVPARDDICPVTKSSVWYDQRELKHIVKSACNDIRRMQDNQRNYQQQIQQQHLLQDPRPDYVRGLESFQSPEARDHRRKLQKSNTSAVLAEQHRQRTKNGFVYDQQKIAMVAAYSSLWSKQTARRMAILDECGRDQLGGVLEEYHREQYLEDRKRTNVVPSGSLQTDSTGDTRVTSNISGNKTASPTQDLWCGSMMLSWVCQGEMPCLSFVFGPEEEELRSTEQVAAPVPSSPPKSSPQRSASQVASPGGGASLKYHHVRHVRRMRR